jgi:methionyl-tRNA formyltransferase
MNPDVLVVHSPYWIGSAVRRIPRLKIVLGGHPGITPFYRGSHSAFWAIYKGRLQDVGCTVFLLNDGLDTGDIVAQRRVPVEAADSFVTLGWKGMIQIAELQAAVLRDLDAGRDVTRRAIRVVPPDSEFDNPKIMQYFQYAWRRRKMFRCLRIQTEHP